MFADSSFSIRKEKIYQVTSVFLSKLAKEDVERFRSAGIKASLFDTREPKVNKFSI